MRQAIIALALAIALLAAGQAAAGARSRQPAAEVPTFQLRARVLSVEGKAPKGQDFTFRFGVPGDPATSTGQGWSGWLKFGPPQVEATLKGYPATYLNGFPDVVRLSVGGGADPTVVEAELVLDETKQTTSLRGELFGPSLGILLWRDERKEPHAATMADYNRRYWQALEGLKFPEDQRPKKFPIVDRFIGGDDDRLDWQQGIEQLARAGFSVIMLPPKARVRDFLLATGLRRTAWAVYNPPGYAFDYDPKVTDKAIAAWARKQAKDYRDAGYAPQDMAIFAMSDEPGWYYPSMFGPLTANAAALARFRIYVERQGLKPADVGAMSWDDLLPIGRSKATSLPARRLFYWTMRFFAWDSARHFAACTRALEQAFYPGLPVLTNWNFFSGRFYVPGPVANNADKQSPDAAMGGHDWLEFGRLRGCTMLWTEDWFPDSMAYQWSFYCSKLRAAAEGGKVAFGGYVIPRTAGDRPDGILQKILCVVGSGGKAIKYFVFGPEYNFPGNCYSENLRVLPKMAEAHRMIGAAEDLLWPGVRPRAEVAILVPRSAEVWDASGIPIPNQIQDATNNHLNRSTVDYMAETFDLYLALQHANIPVDFVDEDDLSAAWLAPYRVLFVTEPDVPAEGQEGIAKWVRLGGTLVTVTGAGARDRYGEPCRVLAELSGLAEEPRERMLVASLDALKPAGKGKGELGEFTAFGPRGILKAGPKAEAAFDDGSPAIVQIEVGRGRVVHFAWMPGLSYAKSAAGKKDGLPVGFSEAVRRWIAWPAQLAKVSPPVVADRAMVETPVLLSTAGAAVTLLNWTGEPIDKLTLTVSVPIPVKTVESVRHGKLDFQKAAGDALTLSLPLGAADILLLRP